LGADATVGAETVSELLKGAIADVRSELGKLADAVDDTAMLARVGALALEWRREMRAFDALPWGTRERNAAFDNLTITATLFWQAVDALLAGESTVRVIPTTPTGPTVE
jgi:hypothetical protein